MYGTSEAIRLVRGKTSLHHQMKNDLFRRLQAGEWRPGEQLPSEIALAQEYRISVGTARKAFEELVASGLLVRQRGRGTTVSTYGTRHIPFRFYRLMSADATRANETIQYLSIDTGRVLPDEAQALKIKTNAQVVRMRRLRSWKQRPLVLEDCCFPKTLGPGLASLITTTKPDSIYALLERKYHLIMGRADDRVSATTADATAAELLDTVQVGDPLIYIERISYDLGGRPLEYRITRAVRELHYFNRIT
jgi:GntR family transcriptional regulator